MHASRLLLLLLTCLAVSLVTSINPGGAAGVIREGVVEQQQQHSRWRELSSTAAAEEAMSCPSTSAQQQAGTSRERGSSSSSTNTNKTEWPELTGKTADEAKAVLAKEAGPGFQIQVIPADHMATADYRCNRVRIWLNKQQLVSQPPRIG